MTETSFSSKRSPPRCLSQPAICREILLRTSVALISGSCATVFPKQSILIYDYATDHLLKVAQKEFHSLQGNGFCGMLFVVLQYCMTRTSFMRSHIKANKILVNYTNGDESIVVKSVRLADLEDTAYVPPGSDIVGSQVGNQLWRSPEVHSPGPVNSLFDMFSYGIICIYVLSWSVIFSPSAKEIEDPGIEPHYIILERQLSYSAEPDTFDALLRYLGPEIPWCEIFTVVRSGSNEQNRGKPFRLWKVEKPGFDQGFMDLAGRTTNFGSAKRITTRDALAYKWFADVED